MPSIFDGLAKLINGCLGDVTLIYFFILFCLMEKRFTLVFDDILKKQLDKSSKDKKIQEILTKMFKKIEFLGPLAGELLDSQEFIYEIKNKHPPIRLYFNQDKETNEIILFEYEMKTSEKKQQNTINKLRRRLKS